MQTPFMSSRGMLTIGMALMLSAPLSAAGSSVSYTSADSSTGGAAASGGATVTGDSSASADVRTVINSNAGVSNVKVEVETVSDGIVHTGLLEKIISPRRTEVHIATSSKVEKHIGRFSGSLFGLSAFFRRLADRLLTFW